MTEFRLYSGGRIRVPLFGGGEWPVMLLKIWGTAFVFWLPYFILIFFADQGQATRWEVLKLNLTGHVRILVALPLLVFAGQLADFRISRALKYFQCQSGATHKRVSLLMKRAEELRDSWWLNLVLLIILVSFLIGRTTSAFESGGWEHLHEIWRVCVGITTFQTVMFLWLSRTLIWLCFLWKLSRFSLQIVPAHPDGKGGLGFLSWIQSSFSWATLGLASILVTDLTKSVPSLSVGVLASILKSLGVSLIINLVTFLGPLLFFTPQLCRVKEEKMMGYTGFADQCSNEYEKNWVLPSCSPEASPKSLLTPDISAICDLIEVDKQSRHMAVVLIDHILIRRFMIVSLVPLLPVLVTEIPARSWISVVEKLLL